MKKIFLILVVQLFIITIGKSADLVNFTLENQVSTGGTVYYADLFAEVISGETWVIGPTTIVISFNTSGLQEISDQDPVELTNINLDLSNNFYIVTQSYYDDGKIAVNICNTTNATQKTNKFRIGTIKWNIINGSLFDNLAFDSQNSIVYNTTTYPTFSKLNFNCGQNTCYNFTNPVSNRIIPELSTPILTAPTDLTTDIILPSELQWNSVIGATSYIVRIGTDELFLNPVVTYETTDPEYSIDLVNLDENMHYFWKVRAKDADEMSYWSDIWEFSTISFPAPTLITPSNNSTSISMTPSLDWSDVNYADSYELRYSEDQTFATYQSQTIVASNYSFSTYLKPLTKYYWRVAAKRNGTYSAWSSDWNFTTKNIGTPTLSLPTNSATNQSFTPVLTWSSVTEAESYEILLSESSSFSSFDTYNSNSSSYTIGSNLKSSCTYYWKVAAKRNGYYGSWSTAFSFTTKQIGTPTLTFPIDGENGTHPITFLWTSVTDATAYQIQVASDIAFNNIFVNITPTSNSYTQSTQLFTPKQTYYWRVKAKSNSSDNAGIWSTIEDFVAKSPLDEPILTSPANASTSISLTPTCSWQSVSNATSYVIDIATDDNFSNIVLNNEVTSTSYTLTSSLNYQTKYYWRVKAKNSLYESLWSEVFNFNTIIQYTIVQPLNNSTGTPRKSYQFDWNSVSSASKYQIQIATDVNFSNISFDVEETLSRYNITYLNKNTQYFWRIRAYINSIWQNWSDTYQTTTENWTGPTLTSPTNNATNQNTSLTLQWQSSSEETNGYDYQVSKSSDFSSFVTSGVNYDALSKAISSLDRATKYYWRVRTNNNYEASDWTTYQFTTKPYDVPDPWDDYIVTSRTATISIPIAINPTINGRAILNGDAIGLFFTDGATKKCAGYGVWNGSNLTITVYGDVTGTPEKEGYAANENFIFKLFDAQNNSEKDAVATYASGNNYFLHLGTSTLASLKTNSETLSINFKSGWNLVSSYLVPLEDSIATMFSPLSNFFIAKNGKGNLYYPALSIDQLKNWDYKIGYVCYFTGYDTLDIEGVSPSDREIALSTGWNMIAHLSSQNLNIADVMGTISAQHFITKNGKGDLYYPALSINQIGTMKKGEGYQTYLTSAANLDFSSFAAKEIPVKLTEKPTFLIRETSPFNMNLLLETNLPDGFEIGAYNSLDMLMGSGCISSGKAMITIFGDNEFSSIIDGCRNNELINFKYLDINSHQLVNISVNDVSSLLDNIEFNEVRYMENGLLKAKITELLPNTQTNITISPNPASNSSVLTIYNPTETYCSIFIYDINGNKISDIANNIQTSKGIIKYDIDISNYPSGVYSIVIQTNENRFVKKLVIVK